MKTLWFTSLCRLKLVYGLFSTVYHRYMKNLIPDCLIEFFCLKHRNFLKKNNLDVSTLITDMCLF